MLILDTKVSASNESSGVRGWLGAGPDHSKGVHAARIPGSVIACVSGV